MAAGFLAVLLGLAPTVAGAQEQEKPEITVGVEESTVVGDGRNQVVFVLTWTGTILSDPGDYTYEVTNNGGMDLGGISTTDTFDFPDLDSGRLEISFTTNVLMPDSAPIEETYGLIARPWSAYTVANGVTTGPAASARTVASATVTVMAPDMVVVPGPPTITVRAVSNSITEGDSAVWELTRTGDTTNRLRVATGYTTHRAGQIEGQFLSFARRVITFDAGSSTTRHTEATEDNVVIEGRTARLTVYTPDTTVDEYEVGEPSVATIMVAENDTELSLEALTPFATEAEEHFIRVRRTGNLDGAVIARITQEFLHQTSPRPITLQVPSGQAVSVDYSASSSNANSVAGDDRVLRFTLNPHEDYIVGEPSVITTVRFDDDGDAVPITAEWCLSGEPEVPEGTTGRIRFTRYGSSAQALTFGFEVSRSRSGADNVLGNLPAGSPLFSYRDQDTFDAGTSTFCYDVPTRGDDIDEPDSVVQVTLDDGGTGWRRANLDGAAMFTVMGGQTQFTVLDDDLPVVIVEAVRERVEESEGSVSFRATRVGSLVAPTTPGFTVRGMYTGRDGMTGLHFIPIARGQLSGESQAEHFLDNSVPSGPVTVTYVIELPSAAATTQYTIGSPSEASVIIYDNDDLPVVSAARVNNEASEGDTLEWTISREGDPAGTAALPVDYVISFSDQHPLAGDTYTLTGDATISAGAASTQVRFDTMEDTTPEPDGTVSLRLDPAPDFTWAVTGTREDQEAATQITLRDDDPAPPTGLAARSGAMAIVLHWAAPLYHGDSDIEGYRIEQSADGSTGWTDLVANTMSTGTSYTHGSLTEGQVVHYRVSTINADSTSAASDPVSGTAGGMGPAAPTGLTATGGILSVRLTWTAPSGVTGITGYRIESSADGSTGWTDLVPDTENTATFYSHLGLTAMQTVHYRVSTIDASFAGPPSGTVSATATALPSNRSTATIIADENTVVGDGVNEVVFIINTSLNRLESAYSLTGSAAITGASAQDSINTHHSFVSGEQYRIQTAALAPGSAPVDVTFTFIANSNGLSESSHAFTVGSATVTVTAPPARVENPVLYRTTAMGADGFNPNITASRWFSQSFTTGSHAAGYDIDSVVLLLRTMNGTARTSTSAVVTLRADDGGDPSDDILATMQPPSMIRHGRLATFPAPASGTRLAASTKYHVVAHVPSGEDDSGINWLSTGVRRSSGIDRYRIHEGTSWMEDSQDALMFQLRGSEAVDLSLPEITLSAEADTVLGDGINFVRFFLTRSMNFPQRRVQYTLPVNGGVNSELETDTEMTYRFGSVGNPERIRLQTEALTLDSDPIDVTFNLLPGTGYRLGDTTSVTVSVVPRPAPALVGTLGDHRGHSLIALPQRGRDYAQGFRTGSNRGGYSLTGILVDIQEITSNFDSSVPVVMTIREEVSGNPAGTVFATLNPPSGFIDGRVVFTAQGSITLAADTRYYFVIGQDDAVGGLALNGAPAARNTPDTGSLAGWSVDDELKWNQGGNWGVATSGNADMRPLVMQLMGEPVAAPNTAPGAPTGLMATAGAEAITLVWTAPGDDGGSAITGYRIERADAAGACSGSSTFPATPLVADTGNTDLTYTDSGLTAGETWCYQVSAINSVGTGAASDPPADATAAAAAPDAPTGLMATAGPLSIVLDWTAPANTGGAAITGYRIERADAVGDCSGTPSFMELVADTGSATASYTDRGLTAGETWCYRVSAINSVGTGPASGTMSATAGAEATADTPPSFGSETIDDQQWSIRTAVTTVNLPVATGGEGVRRYTLTPALPNGVTLSGAPLCTSGCSISGTPEGVSAVRQNATYTWRADDTDSNTAASDAATLMFDITVTAVEPGAPTGLTATAGRLSVALEWTAPVSNGGSAITGYRIERASGDCSGTPSFTELVADTGSATASHTDSGLTADDTWCYQVSAINQVGTGDASNTDSATVLADAAPEFGTASIDDQQWSIRTAVTTVQLPAATGGEGALRYALTPALPNGVQLSGAPNCNPGCSISGTPAGISAVRQNETYTWRVTDSDTNTAASDADELTFTITVVAVVPEAPTGLDVEANVEMLQFVLSWTAPADDGGSAITGYRIERATGSCSGAFTDLEADTGNTAVTHTDNEGLTLDGTWCYRVSAINAMGTGAASAPPVSAAFVSEEQVHAATEAALALLAPNVASNAIQVLTSRFNSFGAPGGASVARNTAKLGGRPLGSFAGSGGSRAEVAREVASLFGVKLPHARGGYGGAASTSGADRSPVGRVAGADYGGAAGYGDGYEAAGGGAGVSGTGGAANVPRELSFAPATRGTLEAQVRENNTGGRGADEASDWHSRNLDGWLGVGDWQSPDLRSLLSQSSFSVALGAADGAGGGLFGGNWTVWGQGAAGGFEGREKDSALWVEGDSISFYLGADVQREGGLTLGVALGLSSGDLEYQGAEENNSGEFETELISLHPYLNWSPNPELSLYLVLGYGTGEADLDVKNLAQTLNSDMEMLMVALGGRRTLADFSSGRRLDVKVDAFLSELETDGARADDVNFNWQAADAQASRLRVALAGTAPLLQGENTLLAEGELAARLDEGDAQTGVGAELGAGLHWQRGGFSLAARGRVLLLHSEGEYEDYKEWGASLTASYDAGAAGRGFRATLSPVWGDAQSDAGALYESSGALRDIGGGAQQRRSGLLPDRLAFEFGYGIGLLGGQAVLLPFGNFTFAGGDSSDTQIRVGARFNLPHALGGGGDALAVHRFGLEVFGEERVGEGAARERRFGLELRAGF